MAPGNVDVDVDVVQKSAIKFQILHAKINYRKEEKTFIFVVSKPRYTC